MQELDILCWFSPLFAFYWDYTFYTYFGGDYWQKKKDTQ